jgi:putative Mn2+ efflux pump MntP
VVLRTLLLIVPLALDTFAVAAAIGMAGLPHRERLRVSLIFAGFEMLMPLVGFAAGRALGSAIGDVADYLAIAVLVGVGASMLRSGEEDEAGAVNAAARVHGLAVIGLGLSISLDELAIGFTIGLLGLPILLIVVLIGLQAFIAAQLGHRLGARLGEHVAEGAERLAGIALVALGVALLVQQVT